MFNKVKSIKVQKYFQMIHPRYKILKIKPHTSIRNYNSSNIAKAIQYMYKPILQRIHIEQKTFRIETPVKCSYFIDIKKNEVLFYFITPEQFSGLIMEKIIETWTQATIEEVVEIPSFNKNALKYQLSYSKEDALSLKIDRKSNEPLNSILNVLDIMVEGDRTGIFYNFMPCIQRGWRVEYSRTLNKLKKNEPIDKEKFNYRYILKEGLIILINLVQDLLDTIGDFCGSERKKTDLSLAEVAISSLMLDDKKKLSCATVSKKDNMVLSTQLVVLSDSLSNKRAENNAVAVLEGYKTISEDNELFYKRISRKNVFYVTDFKIAGVEQNKISVDECQNFLQIPGRELLQQHKIIDKVDVLETRVPEKLQTGSKTLGTNTYKGHPQKVYFTTNSDYKNLAVVYIGPTRSGKTTALANYARDSIMADESIIVLDWIENCGLSEDIKKYIPKEKIVEMDLGSFKNLQGLGYNELDNLDETDPLEVYNIAKLKTNQLDFLINSINTTDTDLRSRMEKYLDAAALTVFICNGPVKDVFNVLQDHTMRHEYAKKIPEAQSENLQDSILTLKELDEWSRGTKDIPPQIIGTKPSLIQGIMSRVTRLKKNTSLELMLKKDTKDNINLAEEIQEGKAIFIKMPENKFGTPEERDIITTYWLTKIWLSLQIRASNIHNRYDRTTVSIIMDELAQLNSAQQLVGMKLDQCAKFGGKFVMSTMYINQLKIRENLRTANTSYLLISGSDKTNYLELKEEFSNFGFTLGDLLHLKPHASMNLIKYEEGYWAGITALPKPIR